MNKKELIEKINAIPWDEGLAVDTLKINRAGLIKLIEQFDEPQKITIPQVVADWIEWTKKDGLDLQDAMNLIAGEQNEKLLRWFYNESNQETFARAWLDGYEVEKEKRYRVSLKNGQPLLKAILGKALYFSQDIAIESYKVTRKELEEAGFGEVFNSPLFEVEEVTE
jgi:hypothetical protein